MAKREVNPRTCAVCGASIRTKNEFGICARTKQCRSKRMRLWKKTDKGRACQKRANRSEKARLRNKKWAQSEKGKAWIVAYRTANLEKARAYGIAYYKANPEKYGKNQTDRRAYGAIWEKKNSKKRLARRREFRKQHPDQQRIRDAIQKNRNPEKRRRQRRDQAKYQRIRLFALDGIQAELLLSKGASNGK
jgi:hypothetical protein